MLLMLVNHMLTAYPLTPPRPRTLPHPIGYHAVRFGFAISRLLLGRMALAH